MLPFLIWTAVATAALLAAEWRGSRTGVWLAKPLASLGFVGTALAAGALETSYGLAVLAALLLSLAGDVLLIPAERPGAFRAGLGSFLLGHVAYAAAFALHGVDGRASLVAAAVVAVPAALVLRWLWPSVPAAMRVPVAAYVVVISAMLALAVGAFVAGGPDAIALGALAFYVSDLAVARDRFVAPGFANRAWGLPLYYGGQLLLASSVL